MKTDLISSLIIAWSGGVLLTESSFNVRVAILLFSLCLLALLATEANPDRVN